MILWLYIACSSPLLPGELVLGEEVAAVVVDGEAGSSFGAALAVGIDSEDALTILVGAPDTDTVYALDAQGSERWSVSGSEGLGTRVGWVGDRPWAWAPGAGVFWLEGDLQQEAALPAATAVSLCPDGEVAFRDGKGESIACDEEGPISTSCDGPSCQVDRAGSSLDGAETSAGSAVGFWGEIACIGDARIEQDESPGVARCEDGTTLSGEPGDHLGLAFGGGRVAGVFNRHTRPPRARIVSLSDQSVWAVDRAAERSRIALGGAEGLVVVGVPGFGASQAREGRVFIVESEQ